MADYVSISAARGLGGLRLVLLRGVPSPWGQAARGIFELKRIPFVPVQRAPDDPPGALLEWTHQDSFPAAMYEDERPRTGWAEILFLAERLGPEPPLIPRDPAERALMFGLSHEICGEMGLAWARRLVLLAPALAGSADPALAGFARKYGSGPVELKAANQRVAEVLGLLARQLREQRAAGREFLVGDRLSAVDLYWATFCNLVAPLPPSQLPMPEDRRAQFGALEPEVKAALDPALLEHRDRIYRQYLRLPVEL
jgi:glutathione S-transferase